MNGDAQWTALTARLGLRGNGHGPVVTFGTTGPVDAFALPAVGGTVHEYATLAHLLDGICRVRGLEAAGLLTGAAPMTSLAAIVARNAELIRRAQPDGPYRLIGWSTGGVLAYETARRLEARGAEVAMVALIDSPFRTVRWRPDPAEDLAAGFAAEVLRGLGRAPRALPGLSAAQQLTLLADRLAAHPGHAEALRDDLERWYAAFVAHATALAGYRADGNVGAGGVLVSAHGSQDWAPYWRGRFRGGVREIATTAGTYGCLHSPAVMTTGAVIRETLS
jgi:thioesterase domain-containing protein